MRITDGLGAKAIKVRKIANSLLFRRSCAIQQVLKAGTWSSHSTFVALYLRDITHRHMDTFSIYFVVAVEEVVKLTSSFGPSVVTHFGFSWRFVMCDILVCRLRESQRPSAREPLVGTWLSLLVAVNPSNYMAVVTVSSHGDIATKHSGCQSLSQMIPLQTNCVFLLLKHSHLVFGGFHCSICMSQAIWREQVWFCSNKEGCYFISSPFC